MAEDDPGLRAVVRRGLDEAGYVVDAVSDGEEALSYLATYEYEVVVLDWRMPGVSGIDVVAELRRRESTVPVLMLTARDLPSDRVQGLDSGADDYLVKPFDFGELLARLRALRRRPAPVQRGELQVGDVTLDPTTLQVTAGDAPVPVTRTELRILELLMRRAPATVSRSSIAIHAWQEEADAVGSNTIDVHIARLRSKLARAGVRIETVRGVGYRLSTARR